MDSDLELFKDYFESINAEDTYPVPGCEENENDPLGFGSEVPLGDLVSDQDLFPPISFLPAENTETHIKQEDPSQQSSSNIPFGSLKIADFAVDPDLCSILQPPASTSTSTSSSYPPASSFHPASISSTYQLPVFQAASPASFIRFSRAEKQLRKVYNFSSFEVQIVTSAAEENSFGQDLKLFISAKEQITNIADREISLTPISDSEYLLHSQQFWLYSDRRDRKWTKQTLTVLDENGTENYFSGIPASSLCLVKKDIYGRSEVQRKIREKNVVKYYYFKEEPSIRFLNQTNVEKLGHEGTPDHPRDPVRRMNVKRLLAGIGHYLKNAIGLSVVPNLEVAALLMEEDMSEQLSFSSEAVSNNIPLAVENFNDLANSKPLYRHLMLKPDIFYLVLTKPHMRVTTQTLSIPAPVRVPRPSMTSTAVSASRAPVLRSLRPQRAAVSNVPIIRVQGQRPHSL